MGGRSGGGSGFGSKSGVGGIPNADFGEGGRGLFINGIEQESEMALKISTKVSWNGNRPKDTSLWIPKSAIAGQGKAISISGKTGEKSDVPYINVKDWFVGSLKFKVNYKGWQGVFNPNMGDISW